MKKWNVATLSLALLVAPAFASAATGWTAAAVNLRAGPDASYPRITTLRPGSRVEVHGCIDGWTWCDVSTGSYRGWVSASYLNYDRQGRRVRISGSGGSLGLQILSFTIGDYWDQNYRGRSWYSQRGEMERRYPRHAGPERGGSPPGDRPPSPRSEDRRDDERRDDERRDDERRDDERRDDDRRDDGRTDTDRRNDGSDDRSESGRENDDRTDDERRREPERRPG